MDAEEIEPFFAEPGKPEALLGPGTYSLACRNLRRALAWLGHRVPIEGNRYDADLEGAVRAFQVDQGHSSRDGVFGPGTRRLLARALAARSPSRNLFRRLGVRRPDHYAFVSYKREDMAAIAPVLSKVSEWGYGTWCDEGIPGGVEWLETIRRRLEGCRVVLAFLSPAAAGSPHVRQELDLALSAGRPVVLVGLGLLSPDALGPPLSALQVLDASRPDFLDRLRWALELAWEGAGAD